MKSAVMALVIALAASAAAAQNAPTPPAPSNAPSQNQRFVIFFSPHVNRNTFLVDTQTGRTWQLQVFTDLQGDPLAWVALDRVDTPADEERIEKKHGLKPAGQTQR